MAGAHRHRGRRGEGQKVAVAGVLGLHRGRAVGIGRDEEQASADPWREEEDEQCVAGGKRKGMCHWMGMGRLSTSLDG